MCCTLKKIIVETNMTTKYTRGAIASITALGILATTARAAISVVNTGYLRDITTRTSYTNAFDAGAADKVVVSACNAGGPSNASLTITYNGEAFTKVPGTSNNRNEGIWYLDNPYTSGAANLVISGGGTTFGAMGMGIVAIAGSSDGYDFEAYRSTVERISNDRRMQRVSASVIGRRGKI